MKRSDLSIDARLAMIIRVLYSPRIDFNDFTATESGNIEIAIQVIGHPIENVIGFRSILDKGNDLMFICWKWNISLSLQILFIIKTFHRRQFYQPLYTSDHCTSSSHCTGVRRLRKSFSFIKIHENDWTRNSD